MTDTACQTVLQNILDFLSFSFPSHLFFFFIFSLYALLSKKHAKVTELVKQAESNPQENGEGAQNSDHVSITSVDYQISVTLQDN